MRLTFRYTMRGYPVELEIIGSSLAPAGAAEILRSCLKNIDIWLEKITLKRIDERGGQLLRPNRPGSSPASQTPRPREENPT